MALSIADPALEAYEALAPFYDRYTDGYDHERWLANLEADPHFTFHLKGRVRADLPATARVITDDAERRVIFPHVARNWRRNDVDTMVRYSPLIEVTFDQARVSAA